MEYIRSYFHTPVRDDLESPLYITWAGHRVCMPEHCIGPRVLENYKLVLVLKGKGVFIQNEKEYSIAAGDMFALFPGIKHFYRTDPQDPWEIFWVSFNGRICDSIMQSINLTLETPVIRNAPSNAAARAMGAIIDDLESNAEPHALKAIGYLYILFSELTPFTKKAAEHNAKSIGKEAVRKALKFIELNYYNEIDAEILCRHVNFSRFHFSRLFKQETGVSIPEYINMVRVQRAKDLLRNTGLSISEISNSIGFADPYYFSRVFRKIENHPPAAYRKQIAGS